MQTIDGILPTRSKINLHSPEDSEFGDPQTQAIVLRRLDKERTRPTRVVTGYNGGEAGLDHYGEEWAMGSQLRLRHDQTGASLGTYEVVGVINLTTQESVGEIPNRKLSHSVMK